MESNCLIIDGQNRLFCGFFNIREPVNLSNAAFFKKVFVSWDTNTICHCFIDKTSIQLFEHFIQYTGV